MWWRALAYKRTLCDSLYIQKRKPASSTSTGADESGEKPAPASATVVTTASDTIGVLYKLDETRNKAKSRLRFEQGKMQAVVAEWDESDKEYQSATKKIDERQTALREALKDAQRKEIRELERLHKIKRDEQEKRLQGERGAEIKKCREESQDKMTKLADEKSCLQTECSRLLEEISAVEENIKIQSKKLATLV